VHGEVANGEERARPVLILASSSPSRLRVLQDAGIDPVVMPAGVDEDETGTSVADTALVLARRKGRAVVELLAGEGLAGPGGPDGAAGGAAGGERRLVLAGDSLLELDGRACGKPGTRDAFLEQWREMAGSEATLWSGHYLCDLASGGEIEEVVGTVVRFGRPTEEELEAYAATGEPLQLAGACSLEGIGAPFIDGIVGDPSNVLGLSLPTLRRMLGRLGYSVVDLWSERVRPPAGGYAS
jgi:septum formation protein